MSLTARRSVFLVIAIAAALRLLLAGIVDLGMDEAYAVAVSRQFQLSWYDHPPMVFWIAGALQAIFGPEVPGFVLRLPFIALSSATTWLLYRLAERHFGAAAGLWAALLFSTAPFFFLSAGSWLVPDGPLLFFLALSALALSRIVEGGDDGGRWADWLIAGAALGLALLSKYHAALYGLGVVLFFAGAPRLRHWLGRPQPWVAAALALLLFSPVIVWNAQNGWASFAFQLGRGGEPTALEPVRLLTLFALEAVYLLPTTMLALLAAIGWGLAAPPGRRESAWFFLALGLPTILVLDLMRFWNADSFPHWAMPGWMFLLPLAGGMLDALGRRLPVLARALAAATLLLFAALLGAAILLVSDWLIRTSLFDMDAFRVEAGSWTGLADGIRQSGILRDDLVLVAGSWRDASRVVEALRAPLPMLAFEVDPHGFAWVDQDRLLGRDALLVVRNWETQAVLVSWAPYFASFELVGTYPTEPGNRHGMDVILARDFRAPYPLPYGPTRP